MQQTVNRNSVHAYSPVMAGPRQLTQAEVDEHFVDVKVARQRLLGFINGYFDRQECK